MSTKSLPALYQIATFGAGFGGHSSHRDRSSERERHPASGMAKSADTCSSTPRLQRAPEFLVQLMVGGDPDLRKALGSQHIAARREGAYTQALAARPSQSTGERVTIGMA